MAENERCTKCGGTAIGVTYHSANQFNMTACTLVIPPQWHTRTKGEHLHYRCGRCGWDWVGEPLDARRAAAS